MNNVQLSPEEQVNRGGYKTEAQSVKVYIHRSLLTTKTVNIQGYSKLREPIKTHENCYPLIW